jgi:hypothetical protein
VDEESEEEEESESDSSLEVPESSDSSLLDTPALSSDELTLPILPRLG